MCSPGQVISSKHLVYIPNISYMKDKSSIISSYITNPLSYIIVYLSKYTLRLSKATKQLLSNNNNTMCYLQSLSESVNFKSSSRKGEKMHEVESLINNPRQYKDNKEDLKPKFSGYQQTYLLN